MGQSQAVEHQGQANAFFEEGQDKLGPRIAGPDPAEIGGVTFGGVVVVCDLGGVVGGK